ncbi:MAG TPA: aminotransferase class V-fold PLP-dependent enzyme [Puia sp.]|jgi:isopenicillin-N epimerase|nr:aminotransferase class V-fold PLP-dependent enzyme [Puia sp.]
MHLPVTPSPFLLDPTIAYLNFGAFGACPLPIFEDYQRWQRELELEPAQFINVNGPRYLERSRKALAGYINCDSDDLVYVTNPSYGVNIIAKSFPLEPGDEILGTNLEYGPCAKTWSYYCEKKGASFIRHPVRLPVTSKEELVAGFLAGVTTRTKAVFISHITSATALILPVQEICAAARQLGLITIVDGAHAPGHVPLDLRDLHADIYTGACHKWMMTPKGSSFLYVRKELQPLFDPLLISHGFDNPHPSSSGFLDYHEAQGTRDYAAFLTIPRAIEFMRENQWPEIAAACRHLVRANALRFCDLLGAEPICPITEDFIGQMFAVTIDTPDPEKLKRQLFESFRIEIAINRMGNRALLRYSINAFNGQQDLDRLYLALEETAAAGSSLVRIRSAASASHAQSSPDQPY